MFYHLKNAAQFPFKYFWWHMISLFYLYSFIQRCLGARNCKTGFQSMNHHCWPLKVLETDLDTSVGSMTLSLLFIWNCSMWNSPKMYKRCIVTDIPTSVRCIQELIISCLDEELSSYSRVMKHTDGGIMFVSFSAAGTEKGRHDEWMECV